MPAMSVAAINSGEAAHSPANFQLTPYTGLARLVKFPVMCCSRLPRLIRSAHMHDAPTSLCSRSPLQPCPQAPTRFLVRSQLLTRV